MGKQKMASWTVMVLFLFAYSPAQSESQLKIDPALLLCLEECRNVMQAAGDKIWRGWDFSKTPILFYRPNVQDVLINYPHQPAGFSRLTGFNPLGEEKIYLRDGETYIPYDGQNTSKEINGLMTLVVADTYSNQRNQLRGVLLSRDKDFAQKWLDDWNFLPNDPYSQISLILHEAFHVFQNKNAPEKQANELTAIDYPLFDSLNNSFWSLEAEVLNDALLRPDQESKIQKINQLIAVRDERRKGLKAEFIGYEDLIEYQEGTAKYIEFAFFKNARNLEPFKPLFAINGFQGYGRILEEILAKKLKEIRDIVAANIDMTGNKFGVGPLRFRLYSSGAALAMLLDEVDLGWKNGIFEEGVYLYDKLKAAVRLTEREKPELLARAKKEYGFAQVEKAKRQFEEEGKIYLQEKLNSILETNSNLVILNYSDLGSRLGLAFTPFGVTRVGENTVIYDLAPLMGEFENKASFKLKKVIPVLVDRGSREIKFAVRTDASTFLHQKENKISVDEFVLEGSRLEININNNRIFIKLLK